LTTPIPRIRASPQIGLFERFALEHGDRQIKRHIAFQDVAVAFRLTPCEVDLDPADNFICHRQTYVTAYPSVQATMCVTMAAPALRRR
jgi:hypothetical protein